MKILFEIDYSQKNLKFINKFDDCYGINYDRKFRIFRI